MDAEYVKLESDVSSLPQLLTRLRSEKYFGANVTFPYKETVIPLLDELDADAQNIGAVNTIAVNDGKLRGFNTDLAGVTATFRNNLKLNLIGKTVMVLGAGGAARACLQASINEKAAEIIIVNRTGARQNSLQTLADKSGKNIRLQYCTFDDFSTIGPERKINLMINATSADKDDLLEILKSISNRVNLEDTILLDLNYGARTLSRDDAAAFAEYYDGLYMLAAQAAESFYIWTGCRADEIQIFDHLSNRIERSS